MQKSIRLRIPRDNITLEEREYVWVEFPDGNLLMREISMAMTREEKK